MSSGHLLREQHSVYLMLFYCLKLKKFPICSLYAKVDFYAATVLLKTRIILVSNQL